MSDSVRPHRWHPTRLLRPWDSPGENTGVGWHLLLKCMKVKTESEVAQSCPTPSDPMGCSLPGSSIHGILQARVLEGCHFLLQPKHTKRQKTLLPLLKSLGQKQGFGSQNRVLTMLPAYNPPKWWAKYLSHASGVTPGNIPTLTPYIEQACTPQGTSKAWEPVLCAPRPPHSPPCIRSSNKALPELLASSQFLLIGEGQEPWW